MQYHKPMKLTLVMVQTVNGKITKGVSSTLSKWTSKEDHEHYMNIVKNAKLIIMGSKTYDSIKKFTPPREGTLRMVITSDPNRYQQEAIAGQVEFTSSSATEIVAQAQARGFTEGFVMGGGHINKLFLEHHLLTDMLLTIEPHLFGSGKPLAQEGDYANELKLIEVKQLNEKGTLLLHYAFLERQE